jgi:hypothetical protein
VGVGGGEGGLRIIVGFLFSSFGVNNSNRMHCTKQNCISVEMVRQPPALYLAYRPPCPSHPPAGEEVTQSYFPLTWTYRERQQRCREQYGFVCSCPRCVEEATWPDSEGEEEGEGSMEVEGGAMGDGVNGWAEAQGDHQQGSGGSVEQEAGDEGAATPEYITLFLLKYVCPVGECGGTLAPLAATPSLYECNMCGQRRTEAEFMAEVEALV